jgi:xylulokinase
MSASLYAGLDSSTQGLTAVVVRVEGRRREVVWRDTVSYDRDLPSYGTRHGVLAHRDPRVVHAPPLMWVEALDQMMARMAAGLGPGRSRLAMIGGSAQQHGSVYLNASGLARLAAPDAASPIAAQLEPGFSRHTSPVWMDASTSEDCAEIERALGGPRAAAALTGSRVYERFTGPQIRRFWRTEPDAYDATARVHLVSSFLASLLAGRDAPVEPGDGAGMSLMDLSAGAWSASAVAATAPGLATKLPATAPSATVIGPLSRYWVDRYAFTPDTRVLAWTGDNPASLIGTGLVGEGRAAISLGTSDTIFGAMDAPRVSPDGTGHVFGSPAGAFMGISVFRNGSLARERVRDMFGLDWDGFSRVLRSSPPGNRGGVVLPWFEPEITPVVVRSGWRHRQIDTRDPAAVIRGVVEGQMLAMARHSRWMGVAIEEIRATGGGSANRELLHVMADVFNARVERFDVTNSAALGAALRAMQADTGAAWDDVLPGFVEPIAGGTVEPNPAAADVYARLALEAEAFERAELAHAEQ